MEKSNTSLINELSSNYRPRPLWKRPRVLFLIWFSSHLIYFLALGAFKSESIFLRSSLVYVLLEILGAVLTGGLFIYFYRHHELKDVWAKAILALTFLFMAAIFLIENFFMGTILHERTFSFMTGDFNCFWHATVSTVGPLLLFPIVFRQFFFSRPVLSMTMMSFHLAFLGSLLIELKCPDRELWHLVLGHQTPVAGVFLLMLVFVILADRKGSFLKFSKS